MSTVFAMAVTVELYLIVSLGVLAFDAFRRGDNRVALSAIAAILPGMGGLFVISQMVGTA